jgi:cyclic pyranopterin phosphate synthase
MNRLPPLVDRFGRIHTDLRVSVTDRCNIRCTYCMPAEGVAFRPHREILAFEEIERFVRVATTLGIRKVRITGGEPLVRKGVCNLVQMLASLPGVDDLALTTNGVLLADCAESLKAAGLDRLNVSLDTLDRARFIEITRCDALDRTLAGIEKALHVGFREIKLNAVAVKNRSEDDVVALARFARRLGVTLRLIEFMPADADRAWTDARVLSGRAIVQLLEAGIGPLDPVETTGSSPAAEFRFRDGTGTIGLIRTVTEPFCDRCCRLRLTAEGRLRNCIFSNADWDVRRLLRSGDSDAALADLIREAVSAKKEQHGNDAGRLAASEIGMYRIGG